MKSDARSYNMYLCEKRIYLSAKTRLVNANHNRPLSFLGTGMYGLLSGTAGRFQTGVVAIRLLSWTTFFPPLPELSLPPDPELVVADASLLAPLE